MIEHHTYTTEELRAAYKKLMEECQRRNLQLVIMPSREETPRQPLQKAIRRSAEEFEAEAGNDGTVTLMPIENTEYFYAVMGIEDHEEFEKLERTLLRLFIDSTQQSTSSPQACGSEEAQEAMNQLTLDQPQAEQVPKGVLSKSAPPRLDFQAMPKVGDWVEAIEAEEMARVAEEAAQEAEKQRLGSQASSVSQQDLVAAEEFFRTYYRKHVPHFACDALVNNPPAYIRCITGEEDFCTYASLDKHLGPSILSLVRSCALEEWRYCQDQTIDWTN
jgi:hypothetical protein